MISDEVTELKAQIYVMRKSHRAEEVKLTNELTEALKKCKPTEREFQEAMNEVLLMSDFLYWLAMHAKEEWGDTGGDANN